MTESARTADLGRRALAAWNDDGTDDPPCDVWWDSHKDTWTDGFEAGYKAALIDGLDAAGTLEP